MTVPPITRRAARGRPFGLRVDDIRSDYRRDHPQTLRAIGRAERRAQRPAERRATVPATVEMPIAAAFVRVPAATR